MAGWIVLGVLYLVIYGCAGWKGVVGFTVFVAVVLAIAATPVFLIVVAVLGIFVYLINPNFDK